MKYDRVRRRLFLQGLGGSVLALPFLPSLLPKNARAQRATAAKRFFAIKSYSTQNVIDWYPSRELSGYSLRPYGGDGGANGKDDGKIGRASCRGGGGRGGRCGSEGEYD